MNRILTMVAASLGAGVLLNACAYTPPTLTDRLALRQVPYTPDSGSIAIRCGRLIDGHADAAQRNVLVVIRDGRIKSVEQDASRGDATATHIPVLDLSSYTCLPGLIDMHGHLTDRPEDTADLTVYFTRPIAETLRQSKENAAATLSAGFTSLRNVGTYVLGTDTALRDEINAGKSLGPRLQASGPYLAVPRGGGDLYIPGFKEPADNARFHAGVARGPEAFRERAEFLLDNGSDLLTVVASGAVPAFGGVPSPDMPSPEEMTPEEIAAVVEVAHAAGKRVAAQAIGAGSIRMAISAGVDTVEHAFYLDEAGIAAALERGRVALAMDVYSGDYIDIEGRRRDWPEEVLRKNVATTEVQRRAFAKAVAAGLPMLFGTDTGVLPHGLNARQFPVMVARGMTPMQAIKSATSVAASYLGWDADVGSIEPGKFGDLIAVRGDPLHDIGVLQNVEVVVKGGMLFKR